MRHSLKYRMAIAAAGVVTLILVTRACYAQFYAYESLRTLLQAQQDTLVKLVAGQLDEKLESREVVLRRLARTLAPHLDSDPAPAVGHCRRRRRTCPKASTPCSWPARTARSRSAPPYRKA